MKNYEYERKWEALITPEIVALLTQIHELKGKQNLFIEQKTDALFSLSEITKVQSIEASNKIEGISTSNERLKRIALDKTTPQSRHEQEIAGYRDVLATIHKNHDYIPVKPSVILQLHRDLYKYSGASIGGNYKNADNLIAEQLPGVTRRTRFQPISAWETPEAMENLCHNYQEVMDNGQANPLLISCMFILDFLCIHPFNDGNGRMSRLLTLLLLYRSGFIVGKYSSLERIIEESKDTYYEALQASSVGWYANENDYAPFVRYMLRVILAAYRAFESHVNAMNVRRLSKPERVAAILKETLGKITKRELVERCPDISNTTIQRTLNELMKNGDILKISGGRYTSYTWNRG